ncbi:MAG: hypothetical protein FWC79_04940 [Oscillospiraceae bacterium]|nr:hypothetical protein [Oscillospiraceae bacterium]
MYNLMSVYAGNTISTITSIITGMVIYVGIIVLIKCLSKEEFHMIPFGPKVYRVLERVKLYK